MATQAGLKMLSKLLANLLTHSLSHFLTFSLTESLIKAVSTPAKKFKKDLVWNNSKTVSGYLKLFLNSLRICLDLLWFCIGFVLVSSQMWAPLKLSYIYWVLGDCSVMLQLTATVYRAPISVSAMEKNELIVSVERATFSTPPIMLPASVSELTGISVIRQNYLRLHFQRSIKGLDQFDQCIHAPRTWL